MLVREIDLDRRCAALQAVYARNLVKVDAAANVTAAAEADAEARLRIGEVKLKAEGKYILFLKVAHRWQLREGINIKLRLNSVVTYGFCKSVDTRRSAII